MRVASAMVWLLLVPALAHAEARPVALRRDAVVYAAESGGAALGRALRGQVYVQVQARTRAAIAWKDGQVAWVDARELEPSRAPLLSVSTASFLNVRARPAPGAPVIGVLRSGALVASTAEQNGYRKVAYAGQDGWVERVYQRPAEPGAEPPASQQPSPPPGGQPSGGGGQPSGGQPSGDQPSGGQPSGGQPSGGQPSGIQPGGEAGQGSGTRNAPTSANASELEVMARIIKGEARDCPWEGKVAVGAVILNRVKHPNWPNSIIAVCHQPKQFSCYNPDQRAKLYDGPIPADCLRAAQEALSGNDPTRGSQYYFNPYLVNPGWARRLVFVRRIGTGRADTHDFYRLP